VVRLRAGSMERKFRSCRLDLDFGRVLHLSVSL
jgi:hypothetical protein